MRILVTAIGSFFGGMATFFTPCVLPLVPAYLIYIAGLGVASEIPSATSSEKNFLKNNILRAINSGAFRHSVFFTLGFTAVFFVLGLSASFLSEVIFANKDIIRLAGGVVLVFMGIFVSGLVTPRFLLKDGRISFFKEKPAGFAGSFLVGAGFAAGWSPCVGPALVAILTLAASRASLKEGMILLASFSSGLAVPFILAGLFTTGLTGFISKVKRHLSWFEKILGLMIAVAGILLISGLI